MACLGCGGDSFGSDHVWSFRAGVVAFAGALFDKFLLESLILAQDERWRRA